MSSRGSVDRQPGADGAVVGLDVDRRQPDGPAYRDHPHHPGAGDPQGGNRALRPGPVVMRVVEDEHLLSLEPSPIDGSDHREALPGGTQVIGDLGSALQQRAVTQGELGHQATTASTGAPVGRWVDGTVTTMSHPDPNRRKSRSVVGRQPRSDQSGQCRRVHLPGLGHPVRPCSRAVGGASGHRSGSRSPRPPEPAASAAAGPGCDSSSRRRNRRGSADRRPRQEGGSQTDRAMEGSPSSDRKGSSGRRCHRMARREWSGSATLRVPRVQPSPVARRARRRLRPDGGGTSPSTG